LAVLKKPRPQMKANMNIPINPLIIKIFATVLPASNFKNIQNIPKNIENNSPTIHIFKNKSTWLNNT
jgi:hypothetical protein